MSVITTSAVLLATSAAVLAINLIPTPLAAQPAQAGTAPQDKAIRPFRVNIPDEALADLRRRIAATKWPKQKRSRMRRKACSSRRCRSSRAIGRRITTGARSRRS